MLEGTIVSMPDILIRKGVTLRSEDIARAECWEAGADWEGYIKGEPPIKADEDTLRFHMKDPETKFNDIKGSDVRRIAEDLEKHVHVSWHRK